METRIQRKPSIWFDSLMMSFFALVVLAAVAGLLGLADLVYSLVDGVPPIGFDMGLAAAIVVVVFVGSFVSGAISMASSGHWRHS